MKFEELKKLKPTKQKPVTLLRKHKNEKFKCVGTSVESDKGNGKKTHKDMIVCEDKRFLPRLIEQFEVA